MVLNFKLPYYKTNYQSSYETRGNETFFSHESLLKTLPHGLRDVCINYGFRFIRFSENNTTSLLELILYTPSSICDEVRRDGVTSHTRLTQERGANVLGVKQESECVWVCSI